MLLFFHDCESRENYTSKIEPGFEKRKGLSLLIQIAQELSKVIYVSILMLRFLIRRLLQVTWTTVFIVFE